MHRMHIRVARLLTLSNHLLGHLGGFTVKEMGSVMAVMMPGCYQRW